MTTRIQNSDEEFRRLVRAFELSQGQDLGAWERLYAYAKRTNLVDQLPTPPWAPRMTTEAIERVFRHAYTYGRHGPRTRVEATYRLGHWYLSGTTRWWPSPDDGNSYLTTRFYVGRSTGSSPIFLIIPNTRSTGGVSLDPQDFVHARLLTPSRSGTTVRWNPDRVANAGLDEEVRRLERAALAGLDAGDPDAVVPWLAALQRLGRLDERVDPEDWTRDLANLVRDWVSEEIDRNAAQAWSQNEDEDQWTIATFGDTVAVNGEVVDLDLPLGREVSVTPPVGYVHTNLGGHIPAAEGYANLEHAVGFVADDVKLPEEVVWAALEEAWDAVWGHGSFASAERHGWEVAGGTSGEGDVYMTPERAIQERRERGIYFEASGIDFEEAEEEAQLERLVNRVISRLGGHTEVDRDVVRAAVERLWREQPHLSDWHFLNEARRALWPEEHENDDPGEPDDGEGA